MKGWLLYDKVGAERNRTFINFWLQAAACRGVDLEIHMIEDTLPAQKPDFAVVRTIAPSISYNLELAGIPVFNSSLVSQICNNKWKTYCHAKTLGIPFPQTEYVANPLEIRSYSYPFVLKSCSGHGGTQVYMIRSEEELKTASSSLQGLPCVIQEVISEPGKDLRIYVLGKEIIAAMLRTSTTDFRSNFCLGGKAEPYTLGDEEKAIVNAFCNSLSFGLVGIDLMFHNGKPVFNEIEDVVGCRMLYTHTDIDPASMYLEYILQNLSNKKAVSLQKL